MSEIKLSNKPSKAEIQRRVALISELLAKKYKRSEIYEYIRNETDWNVTHGTMYRYINQAKGQIAQAISRNAWQNLAESMMDLRHLYRQALESGDLKTALAVRKEMNSVMQVSLENSMNDVTERAGIDDELDTMIADVTPMRKAKA